MYPKTMPGRAWLEISLDNLKQNYRVIEKTLPEDCECMAVVKAEAYGHGAVRAAQAFAAEGCRNFAVATLDEGIALRAAGVEGDILILGYTMPRDAFLLDRYDLIQTIADEAHAQGLAAGGYPVRAHLAVDTGMNRLGISYRDEAAVERVLKRKGLSVEGIYSHMSVADSPLAADRAFTLHQIHCFQSLCAKLKQGGFPYLKCHMQSSYGILNYPMEGMQLARPGILLYGCASNGEETFPASLKPALQLKCRIGCIRRVMAGEFVSYGRTYEAREERLVGVLAIGYADGLPRNLSGRGAVLVRGRKAPILGRVCMDQTMIDLTEIPQAEEGDAATLIGADGEDYLPAAVMAKQAGTITNELLSRLGGRLTRIYTG